MTLIIASKCKDGLILGSDSRSLAIDVAGSRFIRDSTNKLIQLNDYTCILLGGDSQAGVRIIDEFKEEVKDDEGVKSIGKKLSDFCRKEYAPYSSNIILLKNSPEVQFILAGLDKDKEGKYTIPKIFVIKNYDWFFLGEEREYSIVGKDNISNYLFTKQYDKCAVSSEKMTELIVQCLYDTEKIDGESGGEMHLVSITEFGVDPIPTKDYIDAIIQRDLINIMDSNGESILEDKQ
jgi:20S proteasome alpha/beta subunit